MREHLSRTGYFFVQTIPPEKEMTTIMQTISDDERRSLRNLMAALQPFRELSERLPLSIVTAFLGVALKEGRTLGEYAADAGFSLSVASRLFADLGSVNRWGEPGFGLIDVRPDGRATTTKLTPIGSTMVGRVVRSLEYRSATLR